MPWHSEHKIFGIIMVLPTNKSQLKSNLYHEKDFNIYSDTYACHFYFMQKR